MNRCFALYRLPFAQTYTEVAQTEGHVEQFDSCTALNGRSGFVVAPFQVSPSCPILLIRPDHISEHPIEEVATVEEAVSSFQLHRDRYATDFAAFHAQLEAGTFRKIVLARSATLSPNRPIDPKRLFMLACRRYPRLFVALVALPNGHYWLTATPEILLEGIGSDWRTIALAGTMQLQDDELQGEGETMRWSTKNIQEQHYVATYIADTLSRMRISFHEEGPRTVRAANLVHLRSDFTFKLPDASRIGNLLHALHPTPAVCGLPREDTFRFINTHEHTDRQYYSGFMGPMNLHSPLSTHLYVSLRCMQICPDAYRLFAGGGLLKDSNEESEWQETEAKMQTMKSLLGI